MDLPSSAGHDTAGLDTTGLRRLRKGTKSCIECRVRKIRCVWGDAGDAVCVGCKARGRECVPQVYQRRPLNQDRLTSRDRIQRLEQQLANITAAVHHPSQQHNAPSSISPDGAPSAPDDASPTADHPETEFGEVDGIASTPPAHLRTLFGNSLMGAPQHDEDGQSHLSQARVSRRYIEQARSGFQRLMPPREDVLAVATYAAPWMSFYTQLFPASTAIGTRDELITHYEDASAPEAHPVFIANFLLSFAITALQADGAVHLTVAKNATAFANQLCHSVETTIVAHTGLATTLDGLEAIVMYLRLLLAIGSIRTLWLTVRRAIAFAELMGLPRSARLGSSDFEREMMSKADPSRPRTTSTQRVAIWEAISSTDRLSSMMFNLPAATFSHHLPQKEIISPDGDVMPRPYMFALTGFAVRVQELDESYTISGRLSPEMYEKVLATDGGMRALKSKTPVAWWNQIPDTLSPSFLVQYWHYYLTARIHLNSAMIFKDEHDQYAYSRTTCTDACEEMCRRYAELRRLLPRGFFICRIIDMQIFTAATFLLLSCLRQGLQPNQQQQELIQAVLSQMDAVRDPSGAAFVRDAASAIRSLASLVHTGQDGNGSRCLTLRIPFLGKVRIGRQDPREAANTLHPAPHTPEQSQPHSDMHMPSGGEYNPQAPLDPSFDPNIAGMVPWLMELDMGIPALNDTFYLDENPDFGQWTMDQMAFGTSFG